MGDGVGHGDGVGDGVAVGVGTGVTVGEGVAAGEGVGLGVALGTGDGDATEVRVSVGEGDPAGEGSGVPDGDVSGVGEDTSAGPICCSVIAGAPALGCEESGLDGDSSGAAGGSDCACGSRAIGLRDSSSEPALSIRAEAPCAARVASLLG